MNIQNRSLLLSRALLQELTNLPSAQGVPGASQDIRAALQFADARNRLSGCPAGPAETGREARAEKAKQIQESGALGAGESPKPKEPVVTDADRKHMAEIVPKANDDMAVALSRNPKAMAACTPEQKAALVKKLMDGHTNDEEDRAIAAILKSCTSKAEYDKVLELAGGKKAVFDELDDKGAKATLASVDQQWSKAQSAAVNSALLLLEECEDPEEARELAAQLGATQLKHQIKDPAQLRRLEEIAKKHNMPALAYGLPPEVVTQKRGLISQAINKEDSGLATQLAEDRDAMKTASPAEKAALIRELGRGWTKDRQDVAVYKILSSCTSKAEFDEVMQLAGGKDVLNDMDHDETKTKMNELFGAWGRLDLAEDKAYAAKFHNVMADPAKQAELSATRPPTAAEANGIGGGYKSDPSAANDPAMQQANAAMGAVQNNMAKKAFDVDWDPQAKTELVLEQQRRDIQGRPRLDMTELTAKADQITSDPDYKNKVAAFQLAYNKAHPLDPLDSKKAEEKYVESRMDELRAKYGLSEQTMKSLVTQRMGQINAQGAAEANAYGGAILEPLKAQLAQIEATKGPHSPEAAELRQRISKIESATGAYASHLSSVGDIQKNLYKVPPSFAESFVSAFQVIADIAAAVVSCIPGVGNAIGAAYFGVKAIVSAAKGDLLGMFSSIASAIPGVGAAIGGAAGKAISTVGRLAQTGIGAGTSIAEGNILGAITSIGGAAGGILGPLANNPAVQSITQNPIVKTVAGQAQNAIPFFQAIADGDAGRAISALAGGLSPLAASSPEARQALSWLGDGARTVEAIRTGDYGRAINGLTGAFDRLGGIPEVAAFSQGLSSLPTLLNHLPDASFPQGGAAIDQLRSSIAGISGAASGILAAPETRQAFDLISSGARFFDGLAHGNAAQYGGLSQLFSPAVPLLQSMSNGDFDRTLEQLRSNPLTAAAANGLAALSPIATLLQSDWVRSMEQAQTDLQQLAGIASRL